MFNLVVEWLDEMKSRARFNTSRRRFIPTRCTTRYATEPSLTEQEETWQRYKR